MRPDFSFTNWKDRSIAPKDKIVESLFQILHEDAGLLVVNKPAGLVCHPTKTDGRSSLIARARLHLGPDCYPHLINRLDRETSGVILIAKQAEIASALRQLWEQRTVRKQYWAIAHGSIAQDRLLIDAPLGKDETSRVAIKDTVRVDGAEAQTEIAVIRRFQRDGQEFTFVQAQPRTGRKHQIRIHLAHLGHPIVGDKIYGLDETLYLDFVVGKLSAEQTRRLLLPFQALHARSVEFEFRSERQLFQAEPESWFASFAGLQ